MKDNRMKDALENLARRGVPESTNLWPNISARLERKPPMMTLRSRPVVMILVVLLTLLALSGVAYALGRVLGYIPGIGLVEQSPAMRMLEAPVSVERDSVRVTILNVIASPASTSIRFQVEWLTPPSTTGDYDTGCEGTPALMLSNGIQLGFVQTSDKFMVGEPGSGSGYGYVMEFAPIPADQSDVTFLYPCINPLVPGPLPRNWEIPFHLIPAPEGMALPVVTVPVTEPPATQMIEATDPASQATPKVDPTYRIAAAVDSFVPMDDGYLLMGTMQWSASDYPAFGVRPIPYMGYINVLDANGQNVAWEEVYGRNVVPQNEEYRSYWAIKILSKTFTPPLTISMSAVDMRIQPIIFQFDVGAAPQPGQSWDVNQDLQIANSLVRVVKAGLISVDGNLNFQLDVQVDANVIGDLYVNTLLNQCAGGGGGYPTEHLETLQVWVPMCRPDVPPGGVEMQVTGAVLWGQWQVSWQP
jgi:hypothetical protein